MAGLAGWRGLASRGFTDVTLPPQGAGHLAVIVLLRVRSSGGVFVKGVLVGRAVPPLLAILAVFFFRFRMAVSTTGGRRRRENLLAVGQVLRCTGAE